jgi:subtilisin family serine protease
LALTACLSVQARADDQRWILRSTLGISAIQTVCNLITCSLIRSLGDPLQQTFLIVTSNPLATNLTALLGGLTQLLGIVDIELDRSIGLPGPGTGATEAINTLAVLDQTPISFYGSTVWNGYAIQPAAIKVRAAEAQLTFGVAGTGTVALIDTGVDPNHPALQDVLVPGYDFTRNQAGMAPETADLKESTAAVVDGGTPTAINLSAAAFLDESTASVVDGNQAFGHGTMVAGVVHLVAPRANLMPLKAFQASGQGYLSDIVRAVYFAVNSGVRVINMSFSTPSYSSAFKAALDYAAGQNLISVAAAGNDGQQTMVYPAGFTSDVMGIASTNLLDQRSSFSNYGAQIVWVAAPGENIVSTYPFSSYSAGSGTSFSTPFVAGTAALLLNEQWNLNQSTAAAAIANAQPLSPDLGNGRLDIYQAVGSAAGGN